jgi:nucleotide-binding universal stress UspA family protein
MNWLPKKTIVVPIDFSAHSLAALETALGMVNDASAIHAVHVLPMLLVVEPGMTWGGVDDDIRKQETLAALTQRTSDPRLAGLHRHILIGDPGHEIVALAEKLDADLIVMPSHGRTGLKHLLIGSVAERVVRLAHCPVLVLRGHHHEHQQP